MYDAWISRRLQKGRDLGQAGKMSCKRQEVDFLIYFIMHDGVFKHNLAKEGFQQAEQAKFER